RTTFRRPLRSSKRTTSAFPCSSRTTAVEHGKPFDYSCPVSAPHPGTLPDQSARAERLLELVAPKLLLVEEELRRHFESQIRTIHDVGQHILGGGGERLGPALLLLVAKMLRYDGYRDVVYGAVVEFIHNATLVHDDIIDEAAVRRGRTSINYRWGDDLTTLVG